jgi:hypothetical protein
MIETESKIENQIMSPQNLASKLYILYYREGNNPHSQFFLFYQNEDHSLRQVIERIKKHCDRMGLRFVSCRTAIVDLDLAEKLKGSE